MHKNQKEGHNKNIQLTKKLDKEILILPLSIPPILQWRRMGDFLRVIAVLLIIYHNMIVQIIIQINKTFVDIKNKNDVL